MSWQASLVLEPRLTAPRLARRFLSEQLPAHGLGDLLDVAALLTSELVTNAAIHAGSVMTLELAGRDGGIVVGVVDRVIEPPVHRAHTADDVSGRGMDILHSLSDDWGFERLADGKRVWFSLGGPADGVHARARPTVPGRQGRR